MGLPPAILYALVFVVGLCLGSFLNVVITRLPVMLMRRWRGEALEALEMPAESVARFNLATPASLCPRCETPIAWHDNLPLFGWLKRRGRCAQCDQPISMQYPLVEIAGGLLAITVLALYGAVPQALFIYAACLVLLALSVIDFRTYLLPDALTLPLLWLGLVYQLLFQPFMLGDAVIGAMAGYLSLWSFYWLFKLVTGKEGMGYGDFKLLAALGAWLGWPFLPLLLVLSAGLGAVVGLAAQAFSPTLRGKPLPFGPFLALAGWTCLLAGDELFPLYMRLGA
ncbi:MULTISPECIES: A24 family peptidase [unclassified Halomonas]|uniref:prepilin peptidase n=1 Tax=unclassified Halomonas TaxID=2609666 RepID=UPI00209E6AE6|nr:MULTISPECIES: A24 family peptidase [unclassified Halomonas]MCP1314959.1 A24 family peptidase [Halomonas sp. 707D7]MCP1327313.1 A24 family peptidase [Halomonas sp. 707D4]